MVRLLLLYGNFVDAALVAATFKRRFKECLYHLYGLVVADEPAWEGNHVGVIVLSGEAGNLGSPAECGPYPLVLVERHIDAFPAAAYPYAWIALAAFNGLSA